MENKIELLEHEAFLREDAGKFLRYLTAKNGETDFSATFEFSVDAEKYGDWHCDVTLMRREGSCDAPALALSDSLSIAVAGNKATVTVPFLPFAPFELLIRPYADGADGLRRYGMTCVFYHQGRCDGEGNPLFSTVSREDCRIVASESTY
ncbi:MAG: hypothetical protein IKV00_07090, partial [Clostridia bacterium]|nr:hypothetical protein [Clostridia bacterium]